MGREIHHVLRERPQFSRDFAREKLFCIKDSGQLEMHLKVLDRAGVPQRR